MIKILDQTTATAADAERHRTFIIAVLTQATEDLSDIFLGNSGDDLQIGSKNICRACLQHLVDDIVVQLSACLAHKVFTYSEGALISAVLLGEHLTALRLAVDKIKGVHRTVTDIGYHTQSFERRLDRYNRRLTQRIDFYITNSDMIIYIPKSERYLFAL